jgi:hypothetical protein
MAMIMHRNHKSPVNCVSPILETHKKQKLGARRLEKIIEFEHGIHIPHNKIHKVLLGHGLANESKSQTAHPAASCGVFILK